MPSPFLITTIGLSLLVLVLAGHLRATLRQRDEALGLADTALGQRDHLQGELRRAAAATAALFDLVSLGYPWDGVARDHVQVALVMWLANPQDAAARATLEAAGIPVLWLDGAAPILARAAEDTP